MSQASIWRKMRRWFDGRSLHGGPDSALSPDVLNGEPRDDADDAPADTHSGGGMLARRRRQELLMEELHGSYQKLVGLVDSMQGHQAMQGERAAEISSSLQRLAGTLSDIRTAGGEQAQVLARVADELKSANDRAAQWETRMGQLPALIDAQREAMASISRQMESVGERDDKLLESLHSFRETVATLGDATTSSSVAIKSLQMSALESDERIADLLKQQNKRFTMLFVITLVVVVLAATASLVAILK